MIKQNKNSSVLLVISVIVIWGAIGMKVAPYFLDEEKEVTIDDSELLLERDSNFEESRPERNIDDVSYVEVKRDPFLLKKKKTVQRKKPAAAVVQPGKIESIDYVINGVIMRKDKKLVILQDRTNNNIMFLREGDKYKSLKINSITPNMVSLYQNNKEEKINIK